MVNENELTQYNTNKNMKITDANYLLRHIEALQGFSTLGSGTTEPMLIRGVCTTTGEKADYVIKFVNSPRMSVEASSRELIASFMAMELELNVPEPAIINVTQPFVETLRGHQGYKAAANSIGKNFGCRYIEGFMELLWNQKLSEGQLDQARKIFAFDMLILNTDRRTNKPNLLSDGEKIIIFDHELAFGFVFDLITNNTPWIFSDADKHWIENHFFYSTLKSNKYQFEDFIQQFNQLNENFWDKAIVLLPENWRKDQVYFIRTRMTELLSHRQEFLDSLYKILD